MVKKKLAVIGKDVSKSISPQIHKFIASRLNLEMEYDKISIPESEFEGSIDALLQAYSGVNVTIPYKLAVIPRLKKVEGDAKAFGAVNTVNCKNLTGYNTDGLGFMLMLKNSGVVVSKKEVLVIGAGGAGRSVAKKLFDAGATVSVYDRVRSNRAFELDGQALFFNRQRKRGRYAQNRRNFPRGRMPFKPLRGGGGLNIYPAQKRIFATCRVCG